MHYQHALLFGHSSIIILDSIYALTAHFDKDD